MQKALRAAADSVVLDLEDAVPEAEKTGARKTVATALEQRRSRRAEEPSPAPEIFVRINSLASGHWREDVDAVVSEGIAGVRVPKVEGLDDVCRLSDAIERRERSLGMTPGSVKVVGTVESARGVARLDAIGRGPRLSGFCFGASDYCADVGADPSCDHGTLFARSTMVVVSRNRNLQAPIASVYTRLDDDDGLRRDSVRQKAIGFFGRSAIHPRQLPIIHQVFSPTLEEVETAQKVLLAYEAAQAEGRGVTQASGAFIDLAVVRRARAILAQIGDSRNDVFGEDGE